METTIRSKTNIMLESKFLLKYQVGEHHTLTVWNPNFPEGGSVLQFSDATELADALNVLRRISKARNCTLEFWPESFFIDSLPYFDLRAGQLRFDFTFINQRITQMNFGSSANLPVYGDVYLNRMKPSSRITEVGSGDTTLETLVAESYSISTEKTWVTIFETFGQDLSNLFLSSLLDNQWVAGASLILSAVGYTENLTDFVNNYIPKKPTMFLSNAINAGARIKTLTSNEKKLDVQNAIVGENDELTLTLQDSLTTNQMESKKITQLLLEYKPDID